jgi:hypothetical protein
MGWYINSIRVFVGESKEDAGQIVPRLQPLGGGTVLQVFGYESDVRTVKGLVVGEIDKEAIKDLRKDGGYYTLMSPEGALGDFIVKNVVVSRVKCICQTIRPDLPDNSPVYEVEVQLYE